MQVLIVEGRLREIDGELPYYITFTVYERAVQEVVATNDPFLPLLPLTPKYVARYTAKHYFSDGDLNILYYAVQADPAGRYVIQTALNMDSDTAESIISGLPHILAAVSILLLLISYIAAYVIANRTMRAVRVALLHQACTIVISNSVKFAGESAHIELSAEYTHGSEVCAVSISDDGPGIAQDALPHIFERFYRADESHTRSVEGAGLGLSIVSSIMRAIGGSVRAENNREKGVRIVLLLPYRSGYISSSCAN